MDSVLQICKTVFILIVLGVGALLFSADANRLVLIPVDRMVQRVKNIADNPRHKVSSDDQAIPRRLMMQSILWHGPVHLSCSVQAEPSGSLSSPVSLSYVMQSKPGEVSSNSDGFGPADTEMRILEASIDKISELLAVAFGDAGVDIIAENMKCMGGLNPMVPGQRTACPLPSNRHPEALTILCGCCGIATGCAECTPLNVVFLSVLVL